MLRSRSSRMRLTSTFAVVALFGLAACGSGGEASGGGSASKTLVVDNVFQLKTIDPARCFEATSCLLVKQVYETALNFDGADLGTVVPAVTDYAMSKDNKVLTLTLDGAHTFSSGKPVTVDDIVFSYQRLQGLKANPAFFLDGVTVKKVDDKSLTLTSAVANPALVSILPNPSLGIVEKAVVEHNGGTLDAADKSEAYLNKTSAGSGAYQLDEVNMTSRVTLARNANYSGHKPAFDRVVVQNVSASTQKVNVQAGSSQIALDIPSDEAAGLDGGTTQVAEGKSATTVFAWFNTNPKFGGATADPQFTAAVRHAINYDELVKITGAASNRIAGLVPAQFAGALPDDEAAGYDPAAAKVDLAKTGYRGEPVKFLLSSDSDVLAAAAQKIQADLKKVGINLQLSPMPGATMLDTFRGGKFPAGIANWYADFPDASDYLVFAPGQNIAKRAAWLDDGSSASATAIAPFVKAATSAATTGDRAAAYQELQRELNKTGPFIPLYQPGAQIVAAKDLSGVAYNSIFTIDLTAVK